MTDQTIFDAIRRDREAGAPGPWDARRWKGETWPDNRWSVGCDDNFGTTVCISPRYADPSDMTDARRIARTPQLEEIALAARELARMSNAALNQLEFMEGAGNSRVSVDLRNAISAFRKAAGGE